MTKKIDAREMSLEQIQLVIDNNPGVRGVYKNEDHYNRVWVDGPMPLAILVTAQQFEELGFSDALSTDEKAGVDAVRKQEQLINKIKLPLNPRETNNPIIALRLERLNIPFIFVPENRETKELSYNNDQPSTK